MKNFIKTTVATVMMVFLMTFMSFAGSDEEAAKSVTIINDYRQQHGLAVLSVDDTITAAAKIRAAETAVSYSHTRPNGTPWYSVNGNIYGECLAEKHQTAEAAVNAWVNSSTHKELLLGDFAKINVQVYVSGDGTWHWAAEFE